MEFNTDLIKRFLNNSLTDKELSLFNQELKQNPELQDAVDGYRIYLSNHTPEQLDQFLNTMPAYLSVKQSSRKTNLRRSFMAAASILLLFTSAYLIWIGRNSISELDVKDVGLPVHLNLDSADEFRNFTNAYRLGNFTLAESEIKQLYQQYPKHPEVNYYYGILLKSTERYRDAIAMFEAVGEDSTYSDQAGFHKAFCYYYLKDKERARKLFSQIASDPRNNFSERANLILRKM